MSTPSSDIDTNKSAQPPENPLSTARVLRPFTGSLMAGTIAVLFYKMLSAIATSFANKPVTSDNVTVINLSAAVRTLVLGVVALGTGVFAMAALGLALLGSQMIWQRVTGTAIAPDSASSEE
jgi:predicted oxidoreductase